DGPAGVEPYDGGQAAPRRLRAQREAHRRVGGRGGVHLGREGRALRGKGGVLPGARGGRLALGPGRVRGPENGGENGDEGNQRRAVHEAPPSAMAPGSTAWRLRCGGRLGDSPGAL